MWPCGRKSSAPEHDVQTHVSAAGERLPESVLVAILSSGAPAAVKQQLHFQAETVGGNCSAAKKTYHSEIHAGYEGVAPKRARSNGRQRDGSPWKGQGERQGTSQRKAQIAKGISIMVTRTKKGVTPRRENKCHQRMIERATHAGDVGLLRKNEKQMALL